MSESIYSGSNDSSPEPTVTDSMSSFAAFVSPFFGPVPEKPVRVTRAAVNGRLESAAFTHALVALAAKLAAVDGTPNKAEYAAFYALFVEGEGAEAALRRSTFIRMVNDHSSALQYARQIATMTVGQTDLHRDLLDRLVKIATADAALNAAEIELLRAISDCFAIGRDDLRGRLNQTMTQAGASPYTVLGISPKATDAQLREHYLARVQKLHPDRYHAAGATADTIAMLSDQLAAVNAAYRAVQQLRAKKFASPLGQWWGRKNA
ncbi:MAG: DnaJ family molecular chaperone [Rickettsiales bacterium]